MREAKKVCERCPVAVECLAYSVVNWEPVGIWGGKTEIERRRVRRGAIDAGKMLWERDRARDEDKVAMFARVVKWVRGEGIATLGRG